MKDKKVKEQMKSCRSTGDIFCDSMDHSDTHAIKINGYIKKARRSMARLRHLYQKICRLSATTDRRTDAEIWFYSNFYLLDELYRQTYRSLKGKKRARASNKYGESRILTDALCEQLQEKNNYLLTEKTIRSYFEAISETEKLTNSDVLMIPEILILRTVEEIDRSFQNIEGTAESAERVIHCIRSLRAIRDISMEELIQSVSYTEQILLADPGNIYSQCDEKTRAFYRQRVFEYAQKHYISENAAAQYFWDLANRQGKDIGFYLLPRQYHKKQVMYYTSVFGGTLFLTAALFFMFIACNFNMIFSVICTVLAVIPLYEFAKNLTGHIFSKHLSPDILPRLKMESVPDHAKTLVVITTLLCDNKNDQQIFDRLEEYYLGNRDQNVRVGALCDLCDHSNMTSAEDDERILYAKERIAALNRKYGPNFCLFLRRRSYSSNQKRYMGWERKRGALIELVRLIRGRETTFSVVECDRDFLKSVRYVVTLDSDTRLPFASVRELVATMEYPHNRPKIDPEKGIVTEGYGILQPRMMPELTSSRKTRFSMMLTGGGGIDAYSLAAFDLYFHLFGEGIFCGKGIFDVDAFEQCVTDAFPENRVLSHDLLEGTRLRCAIIPDMVFTDGVPSTPMSYFKRQHRWIRGDVQALPFGHRWIESTEKQKQKNPISFLSRYKIKDNIRRSLVPVCSTVLLILGMFLPNRAAALAAIGALLYLVYPALQAFFSCLTHSKISLFRRFFSDVKPVISDIAINLIYSLSSLVYISKLTVDAMVRSFWRMHVSHRNMLEWVTAYEADSHKKSARLQYIRSMWISIVFGAAALIFGASFVKWIGILWIAFPLWCQFLSKGHLEKQGILPNQKEQIKAYAKPMWQYFKNLANKQNHYLPPDNFQISPVEEVATRTSPTNIGLYLLSCLAARDFEFINSAELYESLSNCFETLCMLPKWHGHLYNWYHTETLEVLGEPYVSTVDSGNFFLHLSVLAQGLYDYVDSEPRLLKIESEIQKMLNNVDFSDLYSEKKQLFYLGVRPGDEADSEHYYDMYMSEARATSYFAIARGDVPKVHWEKLSRPVFGYHGHIGFASWTGTGFEYFMPTLVMPSYPGSAAYESLLFAAKMQQLDCKKIEGKTIFGKSESGFFAFDNEMYYQYQAFGVQRLALKRGMGAEQVYAPYASFLMLPFKPRMSLDNLKAFSEVGATGKYGFYEALDATEERVGNGYSIVTSFMAHHLGMSLIACANAYFENIFNKRFMKDALLRSAAELLKEKIPKEAELFQDVYTPDIIPKQRFVAQNFEVKEEEISPFSPTCTAISNGKARIVLSSSGHIILKDGRDIITPSRQELWGTKHSVSIFLHVDGQVFSPFAITNKNTDAKFGFSYTATSATYTACFPRDHSPLAATLTFALSGMESCFSVSASLEGAYENAEFIIAFEPVMMREKDYYAHPAFSKLSVSAEFDAKQSMLIFYRKPRLEDENKRYLAVASNTILCGFDTRMDSALP